jgi:hypothetical protein
MHLSHNMYVASNISGMLIRDDKEDVRNQPRTPAYDLVSGL